MAKPAKNSFPRPAVTKKSEIDTLFAQLFVLYGPVHRHRVFIPEQLIAQARVWRRQRTPDPSALMGVLNTLAAKGLSLPKSCFLIGLCESLFRPLRAAELALEQGFPALLQRGCEAWPPTSAEKALLISEFRQQWKAQEAWYGGEWVLAVGPTPLSLHGRPQLIAAWVAGVAVQRGLRLSSVSEAEAREFALQLVTVLLGRPVRSDEIQAWQARLERIQVPTKAGASLLPAVLMQMTRVAELPTFLAQTITPAWFLNTVSLPPEVCEWMVSMVSGRWSSGRTRVHRKPVASPPPQVRRLNEAATWPEEGEEPLSLSEEGTPLKSVWFSCRGCTEKGMTGNEICLHLEEAHNVRGDLLDIHERRQEIRRKDTGEVLATWRKN
jgi:hypothetical protein